jgi:hypothetical protein
MARKSTRWQFSLRALLVFATAVAAIAAFVANYPIAALIIVGCAAWIFVESGSIVDAVITFSDPKGYARHPFVALTTGLAGGLISGAISAVLDLPGRPV